MMKIKDKHDYLVHLISCAIHDTVPIEKPENISFDDVLDYGIEHEVANIAYLSVKKLKSLPVDMKNRWEQEYWKGVKRDIEQSRARTVILDALHSHGIYTLEVQGTVVKKYYPQRHLRMMSDLDFIVPADKYNDLEPIMQELGYATMSPDGTEIDARKGNIAVELHTEFFDEPSITYPALKNPYSYASLGENYTATVNDTIFYLFNLLHTIKHFMQKGAGVRRIVDLYYLENALKDKVDYEYIDGVLKKYGFYNEKLKLLAIKDYWFEGIEPVIDINEIEHDIRISGNHGTEDLYYIHKFKRERREGKHFVKLRFFLRFLFPDKKSLYSAYPFCKKHHYPIFLCWIHRWICTIFNPKKFGRIKTIFAHISVKEKIN